MTPLQKKRIKKILFGLLIAGGSAGLIYLIIYLSNSNKKSVETINNRDIGETCTDANECVSKNCVSGLCTKNQDVPAENTDVGRKTDVGGECTESNDCNTANCISNKCEPSTVGAPCAKDSDCNTASCLSGLCQVAIVGGKCKFPNECVSANCVSGKCELAKKGGPCAKPGDCATGNCVSGICDVAIVGGPCKISQECLSKNCVSDKCAPAKTGGPCQLASDCQSENCLMSVCAEPIKQELKGPCSQSTQCFSDNCDTSKTCTAKYYLAAGPFIKAKVPVERILKLSDGSTTVYAAKDEGYIKMVSSNQTAKYYADTIITTFNESKWNTATLFKSTVFPLVYELVTN